jgi:hypothetical protein
VVLKTMNKVIIIKPVFFKNIIALLYFFYLDYGPNGLVNIVNRRPIPPFGPSSDLR